MRSVIHIVEGLRGRLVRVKTFAVPAATHVFLDWQCFASFPYNLGACFFIETTQIPIS